MDPNSQHQIWSRWIFGVDASPTKLPTVDECIDNLRRFFKAGFKSVGRVRCDQQGTYYSIVVEVEGPPVHDPEYVLSVRQNFVDNLMLKGFGPSAQLKTFEAGLLAGDAEDGKPPTQMLVMPQLNLKTTLYGV
jgi:hypothetical protein